MKKREHYFAKFDEYRERFRKFSSEHLRNRLPQMSIKEAAAAAKAVLEERGELDSPSLRDSSNVLE